MCSVSTYHDQENGLVQKSIMLELQYDACFSGKMACDLSMGGILYKHL